MTDPSSDQVADLLRAFVRHQYSANSDVTLSQIRDLDGIAYYVDPRSLAFANFIFQHLYAGGQPEFYARKYAEILAALKVGGTFYYAPGLPFVERLLPAARFGVLRQAVPTTQDLEARASTSHGQSIGESAWYSAAVTRLV